MNRIFFLFFLFFYSVTLFGQGKNAFQFKEVDDSASFFVKQPVEAGHEKNDSNQFSLVFSISKGQHSFMLVKTNVNQNYFDVAQNLPFPAVAQILKWGGKDLGQDAPVFIVQKHARVRVEGDPMDFKSIKVEGCHSQAIWRKFRLEEDSLASHYKVLKDHASSSVQQGEVMNQWHLAEFKLVKRYAMQYHDNIVAGIFPIYCQQHELLTQKDFAVLYDILSPAIQSTGYGKDIQDKMNGIP